MDALRVVVGPNRRAGTYQTVQMMEIDSWMRLQGPFIVLDDI